MKPKKLLRPVCRLIGHRFGAPHYLVYTHYRPTYSKSYICVRTCTRCGKVIEHDNP